MEGVDQYIIRTPCSASRGGRSSKASLTCCAKDGGVGVEEAKQQVSPVPLQKDLMSHSSPW